MPFDRVAAKRAGYSDAEIDAYLAGAPRAAAPESISEASYSTGALPTEATLLEQGAGVLPSIAGATGGFLARPFGPAAAIGAAGLFGAGGEAGRRFALREPQDLAALGRAAATQAGLEAGGGILGATARVTGRGLMRAVYPLRQVATRMTRGAAEPGLAAIEAERELVEHLMGPEAPQLPAARTLGERLTRLVSGAGPEASEAGARAAVGARRAAAGEALKAYRGARANKISAHQIVKPLLDLARSKASLTSAQRAHLREMAEDFVQSHKKPMTPEYVKKLVKDYADDAYKHAASEQPFLEEAKRAVAKGGIKQLRGAVPGIKELESRVRVRIGAERAISKAAMPGPRQVFVGAPVTVGGRLGTLTGPRFTSRIARALTLPRNLELLRQSPRGLEALYGLLLNRENR